MHKNLLKIIEKKKSDLINQMQRISLEALQEKIVISEKENVFLKACINRDRTALIAEIKFASPTNPSLGSQDDLLARAKQYEMVGADAISIITEKHVFKGDTLFVERVKKEVALPILQKDFVIDAYQIYEAKTIGSDALLLIARLLDADALKSFVNICNQLAIEPVVEINSEEDLQKAVATTTKIIAVNARDLETLQVDVDRACKLMKKIPERFIKFGFSGITSGEEVLQYTKAGAKAVLIGTSLMKAQNIDEFMKGLRKI